MINELNYDGINFRLSQKHYNKVKKQNSIGINVFGYEDGQPFPIHISKETFEDQMNLLLITKDEKKHYILIKDFNTFMYNQSKHKERKHFCMYCLQCFSSERVLENHVNNCLTINGAQAINMPKQGENILKFNNFHKQLPVPFVMYADFEAITKKVQGCEQSKEMKNEKNKRSYTEAYQTHEDCAYGYNSKNDLILIMTPEKQDKTLELSKHWSVDSTPARNEVIMKRTYPVKSVKCDKICSNY